ncbi:MAG: hypothetical protein EZS28_047398, partial [Streblomastix strix]
MGGLSRPVSMLHPGA